MMRGRREGRREGGARREIGKGWKGVTMMFEEDDDEKPMVKREGGKAGRKGYKDSLTSVSGRWCSRHAVREQWDASGLSGSPIHASLMHVSYSPPSLFCCRVDHSAQLYSSEVWMKRGLNCK